MADTGTIRSVRVLGVHHVAMAVEDLEAAIETWRRLYGADVEQRGRLEEQGVDAAYLTLGSGRVELVAALAPEKLRGSAFGLLATAQSLGNFVASSVAGLLWTLVSPTAAFIYAATWMLIALAAFAAGDRRARPAQ